MQSPVADDYVLAIDPSSTRTGWAVLALNGRVLDAGYMRPAGHKPAAIDRIGQMVGDIGNLVAELQNLRAVIIEIPSGKPGRGSRSAHGAQLAIYGMAVGAIWAAVQYATGTRGINLATVTEDVWTRRVPKHTRQSRLALQFPEYAAAMAKDSGGDVADAIGLGLWWLASWRSAPNSVVSQCRTAHG